MRDSNTEQAFEDVLEGKNVLIHGSAGTGKSTFIKSIVDVFGDSTMLLAPTGLSSINIGGQTIHSAFKMPIKTVFDPKDIKSRKHLRELFKTNIVRRIVMDECGMVTSSTMFFIDKTLQKIMGNRLPFGGIQVILVADFLQLGCIVPIDQRKDYFKAYGYPEAFMYKKWNDLNLSMHNLTVIHRQKDPVFSSALNRMRLGQTTREDLDYFNSRLRKNTDSPIICTSNKRASVVNDQRLSELKGFSKTYRATRSGSFKETPVPENLELKIGAKVVICMNNTTASDDDKKYVNGDVGYVVDMQSSYIKVDTERLGIVKVSKATYNQYEFKPVMKNEQEFKMTYGDEVPKDFKPMMGNGQEFTEDEKSDAELEKCIVGSYTQIPVKLFYAGTTHKSQGLTLDRAHVDLEWKVFCEALPYVAISRVRTLEGLTLERPLRLDDIKVNKRCVDFVLSGGN